MIGFDYTDRIAPAALKAAGCSVVFRYLSVPGWPKNLTVSEAQELLAAGIAIVLNFETTADFMLGGYSAGQACAHSARAQATALGAPRTARIFYSADFNASAGQTPAVVDFLRGAASVDGQAEVGDYAGLRVVTAADAAGFTAWQTVAWSGGQWDPRAVARQTGEQRYVGGVQVDVNEIINLSGLGVWSSSPEPAPNPAPPAISSTDPEDDMPTFSTGEIRPGAGVTTVVCPPPANAGRAGWGDVWFSLGSDFGDAHVRVAAFVHGLGWTDFTQDFLVPAAGDRVNPFGGPLPTGVQKISITRLAGSENVPLSYLIEATHR